MCKNNSHYLGDERSKNLEHFNKTLYSRHMERHITNYLSSLSSLTKKEIYEEYYDSDEIRYNISSSYDNDYFYDEDNCEYDRELMVRVYQDHHGALCLLKCPEISEYISTYHGGAKEYYLHRLDLNRKLLSLIQTLRPLQDLFGFSMYYKYSEWWRVGMDVKYQLVTSSFVVDESEMNENDMPFYLLIVPYLRKPIH